jgi:hypothetical protein
MGENRKNLIMVQHEESGDVCRTSDDCQILCGYSPAQVIVLAAPTVE